MRDNVKQVPFPQALWLPDQSSEDVVKGVMVPGKVYTTRELIQLTRYGPATIGRVIRKMEASGYIERGKTIDSMSGRIVLAYRRREHGKPLASRRRGR